MKKYIKLLYVIAAICLFAVMLVACTPTDGQYTVTYEAGGATGTAPSSEKYDAGESFTLKGADVFTRDGYTFDGWSDGTDVYDAGDEYTMPEKDVTFTARWKENGTNPGGEGTNPGGNTNPGETTSEIEGNWSGAQLSGDLIDAEGANFDVDVAVKQADGGIYVVFGVHGTIQGEDEPISVMMSSAMFMEGDDNEFSAGSGRMNYDGSKLTLTLDLGGEEATTIVFDKKEPLDAAPSVSGSYFATGMNEESVTVDFDAKTLKIVPHQGNNGDDNDNMGSETNKNGNTGSETDTKGDMGDETRGNGDMSSDLRDDIALYDRYKIDMDQMPQSENDGAYDQMPRSETSEGNPSDDDASDGNSSETANVENVEIVYVGKYIVLFGKEQGGTGDQSGMTGNGGMNDQSGMTGNGGAGDQNGMAGSSDISNRNRGMADQNDLSGNGGIFDYRSGMNSQSGLNGQNNIYGNGTDGRQSINSSDRNIITGDEANASRDYDARMDDYGFNDMRRGDIDVNDDYKTIDGREVDGVANDDISDDDGSDTSGSGTSGSGTSGTGTSGSDESGNGSDTSGSDESGNGSGENDTTDGRVPLMVIYEGENNTLIGNTSEGDILVFTKQPIMD